MRLGVLRATMGGVGCFVGLHTVPVALAQTQLGAPTASIACGAANGGGPNSTNYCRIASFKMLPGANVASREMLPP